MKKKVNRRVMYLRDNSYMPVGCVAISVSSDRRQVRYQYSVLNPSDDFERSLARYIALGRLVEKPVRINGWDGNQDKYEITYAVMVDILNSKTAPGRARKAARNWIKNNPDFLSAQKSSDAGNAESSID